MMEFPKADVALFHAINGAASESLEPLMHALSWLADYWRVPLYIGVLAAVGLLRAWRGQRAAAVATGTVACGLALSTAIAVLVTFALKLAFAFPRPSNVLEGVLIFAAPGSEYSFPSGHATVAGLLVATLWPLLTPSGRIVAIFLSAGVAVSRVWLGVHFPRDVAAGLLLGVAIGALTAWLCRVWHRDRSAAVALALASLIAAWNIAIDSTRVGALHNPTTGPSIAATISQLLFAGAALAFVAWLTRKILSHRARSIVSLAYGALLGGILGAVLDVALGGGAVDWIDLHWGVEHSLISAADGAIIAGAALLVCGLRWREAALPRHRIAQERLAASDAVAGPAEFFIVINMLAGRQNHDKTLGIITAELRTAGQRCELLPVRHLSELPRVAALAVRRARKHGGTVVAAGGDGTISAVAHAVAGTGLVLGVLPLGNVNYFAREHAVPLELRGALKLLVAGRPVAVQVGLVNERAFLVNARFGSYPWLLDHEVYKQRYGRTRRLALLSALWTLAFSEQREYAARIGREEGQVSLMRASTLFVGNNAVQLEEAGMKAPNLESGTLVAIGMRPASRPSMLALAWRGAVTSLVRDEHVFRVKFREMQVRRGSLLDDASLVEVTIDGEIVGMTPPFVFRRSAALLLLSRPRDEPEQR